MTCGGWKSAAPWSRVIVMLPDTTLDRPKSATEQDGGTFNYISNNFRVPCLVSRLRDL